MKRKITPMILLAVLMSVGMTACGNTNTSKQSNTNYENFEKPSQDDINYTSEEIEEEESTEQYEQSLTGNGTGDIYEPTEEDLEIIDEATLAQQEAQEADEQIQSESVADYTVESMDAQTMYAQSSVNLRQGPSTEYEKVGSLSTNQSVTVTGYVETASGKWYQLSTGEFVSAKYLGTDKVVVQAPSNNNNSSNNNNTSNNNSNSNTGSSQSSSSGEEKTATSSGSGTGDGSSRANRSGSDLDYTDASAGGNLH